MNSGRNTVFLIFTLLSIICVWLFCGSPTKPDFNKPPLIGNGKAVFTTGTTDYGTSYLMYLEVSGATPITFQWYKDNAALGDKTDDSLSFSALNLSDSGIYYCIAINEYGYDTSLTDTLRITIANNTPPVLLTDTTLASGTPQADSSFFMYVKAIGSDTLKYQWYKNDTIMNGEVNDSLSFSALQYADSGYYRCRVMNDFGADTSHPYHLAFIIDNYYPEWTVDTMHVILNEGATCTLTLTDSCTDIDNDTLTFTLSDTVPVGDTIIENNYIYTPSFNDSGTYFITIQAFDGKAYSSVILMMTVININRPPQFQQDFPKDKYHVPEDSSLIVTFKAIDPDGDQVYYNILLNELPHAIDTFYNDSQYVWTSTNEDSGYYNVALVVTDSMVGDTARFLVLVGNVNRPPEILIDTIGEGDTLKITETQTLSFTVTASDPDSGNVSYLIPAKNLPADANYSIASGSFSYTPDFSVTDGLNSPYTFPDITFYATDSVNEMGVDSFIIHIAVFDSNSAPVWSTGSAQLSVTEGSTISYDISAVFSGDKEGEVVTFSNAFGTFNIDTTSWSWTPDFNSFSGKNDTICLITAADNHVPPASSDLALTITVSDSTPAVALSQPTALSYNSLQISWTQSSDLDFSAYKVFYSTSSNVDETSTAGDIISNQLTTTNTIIGLAENTRYYVKVYVYNTHLSKAASNEVDESTPILGAPILTITIPTVNNDSASLYVSTPTLSGTASSDAGIASPLTAEINDNGVTVTGTTSWNFSAASPNTNQKAWNKIDITATDNESKATTKTFHMYYKPDLGTPAKPTITDTTNRSITLSWSAVAECDRYLLHRSRDGVNYIVIKDTTSTECKDTLLDINTQYWYKVSGYYTSQGVSDTTDESLPNDAVTENWFECVYDFGGDNEYGKAIVKTIDGFVIVGFSNYSSKNLVVFKINNSGDTLWSERHNGTPNSIENAQGGGFIVGAESLLKVGFNGKYEWDKDYGDNKILHAYQTTDGGYVTFGERSSNTTITKTTTSGDSVWETTFSQDEDLGGNHCKNGTICLDGGYVAVSLVCNSGAALLSKVSSSGDSLWSRPFFDQQDTVIDPSAIIQAIDGSFILVGPSFISNFKEGSLYKIFYDWSKYFHKYYFRDIKLTNDDNYILTGDYGDSPMDSLCIMKTDFSGNMIWSNKFFSGKSVSGNSILQTDDGGFIICGKRKGLDDKYDIFILKTDENGNIGQ